jgi:hypothetical protein
MGSNLKSHIFWNPQPAVNIATAIGTERMGRAAIVLKDKIKSNLSTIIKHQVSRPMYKTGDDKEKWWTARDAGELMHSVRIVSSPDPKQRNIWVIAGSKKAYYAVMFERASTPARGKAYFRPAIAATKHEMITIIEKG